MPNHGRLSPCITACRSFVLIFVFSDLAAGGPRDEDSNCQSHVHPEMKKPISDDEGDTNEG